MSHSIYNPYAQFSSETILNWINPMCHVTMTGHVTAMQSARQDVITADKPSTQIALVFSLPHALLPSWHGALHDRQKCVVLALASLCSSVSQLSYITAQLRPLAQSTGMTLLAFRTVTRLLSELPAANCRIAINTTIDNNGYFKLLAALLFSKATALFFVAFSLHTGFI